MNNELPSNTKERAEKIAQLLVKHPELQSQIEDMLNLVNVEKQLFDSADEAELAVLDLTRKVGKNLLHEWASEKHDSCVKTSKTDKITFDGKKN